MEEQGATFNDELAVFLKTAAGGQSANTAQTYGQALAYLRRYLAEAHHWTEITPIADLTPNMLQEFPAWLLQQRYQPSGYTAPVPLAETTRSLYLTATARFLRFLVLHKNLPIFDYVEYTRLEEELHQATNVKSKPVDQKIPPVEIVAALIDAVRQPPQLAEQLTPGDRQRHHLAWLRDLAIILALKSSGLRVGELVSLKRGDLDYGRQGAWVTGKGRKTRFVAFDDEAWTAIQVICLNTADK